MTFPPASWVISIMRPSTCAGTPESMLRGGDPSRSGQLRLTRSWLPPIPPEVTITAPAAKENSPTASRLLERPRAHASGASTVPDTPSPGVSASTRWRKRRSTSPRSRAARTCRTNGSISPGPVPQVRWKRGTEFPCPMAP
jgi:hypothetical protein